ncbi:hypothetical protein QBC38DRAFT_497797 [Podospora fimiseda]|uniref:Uncharacterized protein n=1 Tax=Podospora fimiseda TaxID=252190 RepID=A0AAN7BUK3_9PEZI|nr:hypothetical protein QBC38DRAFT_497797 [Podospora fimiseda]
MASPPRRFSLIAIPPWGLHLAQQTNQQEKKAGKKSFFHILRNDHRDALIQSALIDLHVGDSECFVRLRKRDAQAIVVNAINMITKGLEEGQIKADEGIIDFLERAAEWSELGRNLYKEIW